ncbi:MAG: TetR/AcrR family transcriptional regulator [Clostridia bacterium]|nr:TetR/AcrR family transcriptional regulator [Clostridia bacterium]
MTIYKNARLKKKQKIIDAFWSLYKKNNYENVMDVKEIISLAGINRSTFYYYYRGTHEVLDEIIATLKSAFVSVFSSPLRINGDFKAFYKQLGDLFHDYKEYLVPLVCESRHPEFAKWYRDNQRENFKEDIGLARYRTDNRKNQIINVALSGIIEEQVQTFGYGELSIEDSFLFEFGLLNSGLLDTLKNNFNIFAINNNK